MNNIPSTPCPAPVPSRLYKYLSAERALEVLHSHEIYFARSQELNDPFDGKMTPDFSTVEKTKEFTNYYATEARMNKGISEHDKKKLTAEQNRINDDENYAMDLAINYPHDPNIGFYCLTETRSSLLMWAHYAQNHTGCCLVFNFEKHPWNCVDFAPNAWPFTLIYRVNYSPEFPKIPPSPFDVLTSAYFVKSKEWEYEKEWRVIMYDGCFVFPISRITLAEYFQKTWGNDETGMLKRMHGARTYPINKKLFHGIILGHRMKPQVKYCIAQHARKLGVKIYQSRPKSYEYGMECTEIKP